MKSWQLERIKGKVEEMRGELSVRVYGAENVRYKIWYNPSDQVALYGRVTWDKQKHKDKMHKAWAEEVVEEINQKGAKIHVQYRNHTKKTAWFGPEKDMKPVSEFYGYVLSFKKPNTNTDGNRRQNARPTTPEKTKP